MTKKPGWEKTDTHGYMTGKAGRHREKTRENRLKTMII